MLPAKWMFLVVIIQMIIVMLTLPAMPFFHPNPHPFALPIILLVETT
jgi:hypothetical protein